MTKISDHNANLAFLRVIKDEAKPEIDQYFSMIVNRWHDDVTEHFREEQRLRPELDTATFLPGFIGSYPNYFFEVREKELPAFFKMLQTYDGCPESQKELGRFGVNRADELRKDTTIPEKIQ